MAYIGMMACQFGIRNPVDYARKREKSLRESSTTLTNQQRKNFIDITFDFASNTYKLYRKLNLSESTDINQS